MKKLTLEMAMDNAAFEDPFEPQHLLTKVGADIREGRKDGKIVDINGTAVGHWEVAE